MQFMKIFQSTINTEKVLTHTFRSEFFTSDMKIIPSLKEEKYLKYLIYQC